MANLRSNLIRLASSMPKGSSERKALLDVLAENKGTSTKKASAYNYNYKAVGVADPALVGLLVTAHKRAEECMDTLTVAHKRVHALVKKIEADLKNLKVESANRDEPADDQKYEDLHGALNAAESLQKLLDDEVESYSLSRIRQLVDELNLEGILR